MTASTTGYKTEHTCLSRGAFGQYDPTCPRCQELVIEKQMANSDATVTISRPARPDYPQATAPVRVTEAQYQTPNVIRKIVEQNEYEPDKPTVTYHYAGKSYHGCLSYEQPRYNAQGMMLGIDVMYVLYPTTEQRDFALDERNEQRRQQELQRQELRRLQMAQHSDLIGQNGLPVTAGTQGVNFLGGFAAMPPIAGLR